MKDFTSSTADLFRGVRAAGSNGDTSDVLTDCV
jgi:hypothetical protein